MRTTVDLPEDALRQVRNIAADLPTSVSKVVAGMVTAAVSPPSEDDLPRVVADPETGPKAIHFGRPITTEEVRRLLDDE